jgi:polysaccharide export outer membrane protein
MRRFLGLSCCVLLLAGCAKQLPTAPPVEDAYRLDSGDRVRVIVYGETSLSTDYGVDDAGDISFPMIGQIEARNATAQDLRNRITSALVQKGILANPGVSVEITQYRPFFILGEVNKPGQYPSGSDLNILSAVAVAGGFTVRADKNDISVLRTKDGQSHEWHVDLAAKLQPGDVITVPEQFP